MSSTENDFFNGKREWSKLKDEVLRKYLPPYLKKVNKLNKKIILIDSFAGPGIFDDGEKGSPMYICELAEEFVPNNYQALLVNQEITHHNKLNEVLQKYTQQKKAIALYGSANDLLNLLHTIITDQTLFLYLDPFGLKGTSFNTLEKYLCRNKFYSTEILINLSIPTILRLSSLNAVAQKGITPIIKGKHQVLNEALGGDYWKDFLLDTNLSTEVRIAKTIDEYCKRLNYYLPYVGSCPVHEKTEFSKIKYSIIFASRHPDAQELMNDIMYKAYNRHIWKSFSNDTLFGEIEWEDTIPDTYFINLKQDIIELLHQNGKLPRETLWFNLVRLKFMRYQKKDFNSVVNELISQGHLAFIDVKGTNKLNELSILYLKKR